MDYRDKRSYDQTFKEQEYPTPAPLPRQSSSGMVTLGLSIFAGIMFVSLFFSGINVAITVVSTAVVYGGIITLVLLIDSGTLAYWLGKREDARTRREEMHLVYGYHNQRISVVEGVQAERALPEPPLPQLPASSTFVAPTAEPDDSVKREALAWVAQLYGSDGQPDPKKVLLKSGKEKPGRIRIASPSRPAKEYLLERRVIFDLGGTGYRLNIARCPTVEAAQHHVYRFNGVGGVHTTHLHTTTPHTIGEVSA